MASRSSSPELIFVVVTQILEEGGGRLRRRRLVVGDAVHPQMVVNDVGDRLRIGRRTGSTAPDGIMNLGQLVRHPIGDVCPRRRPTIGSQDDSAVEGDGHAVGHVSAPNETTGMILEEGGGRKGENNGHGRSKTRGVVMLVLTIASLDHFDRPTNLTSPCLRCSISTWMPSRSRSGERRAHQ